MRPNHAGQVVRIKLENFMCYDHIEIYPKNNLNLIIGPNGSGKSSIVCAVVLGLGGKLKALGRADHLSSYVKTGCDQCTIEIELYEPNGQNVVVKRKILSNNHSDFMINGKISTLTKVNEIKRHYSIQIDNLCTFLPQERVQEFAELNPQQLLDQTQKTVGHGDLVQLYEELKRLQSKAADEEKRYQLLENELENEKQKNERLKDRVNCLKEKQSLCEKLVTLKQKKAWLNYDKEVHIKEEVDQDCELAKKDCAQKKNEVIELNKALDLAENLLASHLKKFTDAKKDEAGRKRAMEECAERAERQMDDLDDLKNFVRSRREEEENKKREMLAYEEEIEKLSNDLEAFDAKIGSEAQLHSQKEEAEKKLREIHAQESSLMDIKVNLEEEEDTLRQELRNTMHQYENLKKRRNIRLEYLRRHDPDVYKSMEWLEKNRELFKSHVYNPMLIELDVLNPKMAKFVESRVNYRDLVSFTCTNPDDLNLLIRKLRTEQQLQVNAVCSDEYDSSQYAPEIPINNLRCYGFHSYLKDLVTGPEDIIRFLCKTYKIHRVPVGDETVQANCARVPPSIQFFFSENHSFTVKYSAYSKNRSTSVKKLREPVIFKESLDQSRIEILEERQKDLESKIKEKQKEMRDVDARRERLRETLAQVKSRARELGTRVEERRRIQTNLSLAQRNHRSIQETLGEPGEIEREADSRREGLKKKFLRNLDELKRASEEAEKSRASRQLFEIEYRVNKLGKKQLLERRGRCSEELTRKETMLREMKERQRTAELKCSQLKERAKQLTNQISRGERAFKKFEEKFARLPNTLDEIEASIVETQTGADLLGGGSYEVLKEFEEREEKICQLSRSLEVSKRDLEQRRAALDSKHESWLNPVENLVSKINENFGKFFEAMNCAGEVSLICGEDRRDLGSYGIRIRVKFRDGVPLQDLGGRFQSGGERAVSTAIFILSLQELTSVPFRFVDEINQGMDPENERRILQLLIYVTDSEHSTQYFFITPKLLPDVKCSGTMTVHCIHKGANAIPAAEWDMRKFLRKETSDDDDEEEEEEEEDGAEDEEEEENVAEDEEEDILS